MVLWLQILIWFFFWSVCAKDALIFLSNPVIISFHQIGHILLHFCSSHVSCSHNVQRNLSFFHIFGEFNIFIEVILQNVKSRWDRCDILKRDFVSERNDGLKRSFLGLKRRHIPFAFPWEKCYGRNIAIQCFDNARPWTISSHLCKNNVVLHDISFIYFHFSKCLKSNFQIKLFYFHNALWILSY